MNTTIVYGKVFADHFWGNRASTSPSFNDRTIIATKRRHFFSELEVDEWAFFE
jgi:hypothetical protein